MNAHTFPPRITPDSDAEAVDRLLELPEWGQSPSPFDWQVMVYGGCNPRTGFPQEPLLFQFFKRRFGTGYTFESVVRRAEDMAERQHRSHFAVRDTDGSVVHVGECRRWASLNELSKGLRQFNRDNRL